MNKCHRRSLSPTKRSRARSTSWWTQWSKGTRTRVEVQESIRRWWKLIHPSDRAVAQKYLLMVLEKSNYNSGGHCARPSRRQRIQSRPRPGHGTNSHSPRPHCHQQPGLKNTFRNAKPGIVPGFFFATTNSRSMQRYLEKIPLQIRLREHISRGVGAGRDRNMFDEPRTMQERPSLMDKSIPEAGKSGNDLPAGTGIASVFSGEFAVSLATLAT